MFNLLVKYSGWAEGRDTIPAARAFEYTSEAMLERFRPDGKIDFDSVLRFPAAFLQENTGNVADHPVRIGSIIRVRSDGRDLALEYAFDPTVPPLTNEVL